ncbi:FixH family protein [Halobacillus litoralis]|uniref:YtkA-like domain-containing protein n=1 Tax=Halobacillus litoralis TaxID=45668 RepID=A0A410MB87_9BACI|nr:FixH family protein [Halobacillus litoralis]QAS51915.1 hypothetical protein HLI_06635 [Halobacillus litoralis]
MKNLAIFILIIISMTLAACGSDDGENNTSNADEQDTQNNEVPETPEVMVSFDHQPLPVGEETTIKAKVTQGDEPVPDAEYVKFEIWNKGDSQDSSQTIEAEHTDDGVYEITHTFDEAGSYQVIAHTQVDDLHTMPKSEVKVGKDSEVSEHSHSEESGKFMVHLETEQKFKAGEKSPLVVHINHMEDPFTKGLVKFEISADHMEKHLYVDAEEVEPGMYKTSHNFSEPGTYTINTHYEKPDEEIHGHKEKTIEVTE